MTVRDYNLLKQKLDEIIDTAEGFPESVRESVYESLVEALLRERVDDFEKSTTDHLLTEIRQEADSYGQGLIDLETQSEFSAYLEKYKGVVLNDMEFCALVARFFTLDAAQEIRMVEIGPEQLRGAVRIAGRQRRPANAATTLNNAKNLGGYLESVGKGVYSLTEKGIRMLDEKLGTSSMD